MRNTPASIHPALAALLARAHAFLDEAESAMAAAEPERIALSGSQWAPLARELKKTPDAHWPDPALKVALLGTLASRIAALQQAVGRAQVRTTRELSMLLGADAPDTSSSPASSGARLDALRPVYDAGGGRGGTVRTSGTYA